MFEKRSIVFVVLLFFSFTGIGFSASYIWKCMYCQQAIVSEKNSPPYSGYCDRAPKKRHKWIRQYN